MAQGARGWEVLESAPPTRRLHRVGVDMTATTRSEVRIGPMVAAGLVLGIGLGGFVDGILLHPILQWHAMLSSLVRPSGRALVPGTQLARHGSMVEGNIAVPALVGVVAVGLGVLVHGRRKASRGQ